MCRSTSSIRPSSDWPWSTPIRSRGGDAAANAEIAASVFAGEPGAHRDIVILNAAAGLVVGGLADDMATALDLAPRVDRRGPSGGRPRPPPRGVQPVLTPSFWRR